MVSIPGVVSAFFEPGAPPAPLPLLTAQTDLFYNSQPPPIIVAREELLTRPDVAPGSVGRATRPTHSRRRPIAPYPRPSRAHPSRLPANGDNSPVNDDGESEVSSVDSSDDGNIPKPSGEPGRPGRGGYNLEDAINWSPSNFKKLKKHIHRLVENHLDLTKSFSGQSLNVVRVVRTAALEEFPELVNYQGCWPVMDLIKMRLKYTSVRARREEDKMVAGRRRGVR